MEVQIFNYEGNKIPFLTRNGDVMVNLTEVAKAFPDKNLSQIVNSKEIQDYIKHLVEIRNYISTDLLRVNKGGNIKNQGTWANRRVALRVFQKLSTPFAIWVDEKIEDLLNNGFTELQPINDDAVLLKAMNILNTRLSEKDKEISVLKPKAELMDKVFKTDNKIDIGQAAKILNLPYGRNTLFKKLREEGIFFKNRNEPKQSFIKKGYFFLKEEYVESIGKVFIKVLVSQKGLAFIDSLFGIEIKPEKTLTLIS